MRMKMRCETAVSLVLCIVAGCAPPPDAEAGDWQVEAGGAGESAAEAALPEHAVAAAEAALTQDDVFIGNQLAVGNGQGLGVIVPPPDGFSIDRGGFMGLDDIQFFTLPNKSGTFALTSDLVPGPRGPAGPQGARGPAGPAGPPGPAVTTFAICQDGAVATGGGLCQFNNGCSAMCSNVRGSASGTCTLRADTGTCSARPAFTTGNQMCPGTCCVCSP